MSWINTETGAFPYSLDDFRRDNPNISIPVAPTVEDMAAFGVEWVEVADCPADDRTCRWDGPIPSRKNGRWQATWIQRDATDEEISAWDVAHAPAPDWSSFAVDMIMEPMTQSWFNGLPAAVAHGLSTGLNDASHGDPRLFTRLWSRLAPPAEMRSAIAEAAKLHNLPPEFIASLAL